MHRNELPQGANVTYSHIVYGICPQNKETQRVQLAVGGYKLDFDGTVSKPTSYVNTYKLHWNCVISTQETKYLGVDVNNFYLNNLMTNNEYYMIALRLIPQDIIDNYNLMDKQIIVFLYVITEKGMYGLFQAGIIAHTALKEHLQLSGYEPAPIMPGLWHHKIME